MKRNSRYQVTMAKRLEDAKGREITVFKSISNAEQNGLADDMLTATFQGYAPVNKLRKRVEGDRWAI